MTFIGVMSSNYRSVYPPAQSPVDDETDDDFSCPVCFDKFSVEDTSEKKPVVACPLHTVCLECFRKINESKKCPQCRQPLFSITAVTDNKVKMALEKVELQRKKNIGQSGIRSQAVVPMEIVQPFITKVPENFECITFTENDRPEPAIVDKIQYSLPDVSKTMNWQESASKELWDTFRNFNQQFVALTANKKIYGVAQLKPIDNKAYEIHWTGVTTPDTNLYLSLYRDLLLHVRSKSTYGPWKDVSLTSYFNYDTEEKWLLAVKSYLMEKKIHFDCVTLHKHWGTQVKLTAFPVPKQGHTLQEAIIPELQYALEFANSKGKTASKKVQDCIDRGAGPLFLSWAHDSNLNPPTTSASGMKTALEENPQDFFIYAVGGNMKGFIRFTEIKGQILVHAFGMLPESYKYASHLLEQFAKSQQGKEIDLLALRRSHQVNLPAPIRDAIDRYLASSTV